MSPFTKPMSILRLPVDPTRGVFWLRQQLSLHGWNRNAVACKCFQLRDQAAKPSKNVALLGARRPPTPSFLEEWIVTFCASAENICRDPVEVWHVPKKGFMEVGNSNIEMFEPHLKYWVHIMPEFR